jgi:hypothetical protein
MRSAWESKNEAEGTRTLLTYLLTGNPDKRGGMKEEDYRSHLRECIGQGSSDDIWTVAYADEEAVEKVATKCAQQAGYAVLLRQGGKKPEERGIIGFGERVPGIPKPWPQGSQKRVRLEGPVRFFNLKPLRVQPFLSVHDLQKFGWKKSLCETQQSGHELSPEDMESLDQCCAAILGVSLSVLCTSRVQGL